MQPSPSGMTDLAGEAGSLEEQLSALAPGDHLCLIYDSWNEQFAAVVPFIRDGLANNQQCLYVADDRTIANVRHALREAGVDVETEEEREALRIVSKRETYLRQGVFDPAAMIDLLRGATGEAVARGYSALRATGEMTWALGPGAGTERLIEYEALLNEFFPGSKALAICQYNRRRFPPEIILEVLRTHPIAIVGSRVCNNPYYEKPQAVLAPPPAGRRVDWMLTQLQRINEIETALKTSQERFAGIVAMAPDAVISIDETQHVALFNQAAERMFGYASAEIVGQPLDVLIPARFQETHRRLVERLGNSADTTRPMGTGRPVVGVRRNGEEFPAECAISRLSVNKGMLFTAIVRDVTSRERAERELQRVTRALRTISSCNAALVRATEEAILFDNVCRNIVEVGGYRFAWVGLAEQDEERHVRPAGWAGSGGDYLEGADIRWSDSERGRGPTGTAIRQKTAQVARSISTDPAFAPWRADAIALGYAASVALPLTVNGVTIGALSIYSSDPESFDAEELRLLTELAEDLAYGVAALRDRAEREQAQAALQSSEARYRSLFEDIPAGVYRTMPDGRFLEANRMCAEMLGFAHERALVGTSALEMYAEPADRDRWHRLVETGGNVAGAELQVRRADGKAIWVRDTARPVRDSNGGVLYYEGVLEDITARRQLEEGFRQAQKMEAIGRLAGGVAHDFNNLLTVIDANAAFAVERLAPRDPARGDIEEIRQAVRRATALTRQLLVFSRRQELQAKSLNLNTVVSNMDKMLQRLIGDDIDLVTVLDPSVRPILADPGQIEQVILNLTVNARDAMPDGGRLTIETRAVRLDATWLHGIEDFRPGHYVMLAVSDTGTGMPKEIQQRIFEPFFTTKTHGTGLGLATVYGIVTQSGGQITVYSEPGAGAVFKVYLPETEAVCEAVVEPMANTAAMHATETVLLVEDEDAVRAVAKRVLERQGYTVLEAPGGPDALQVAERYADRIDVLVTDVIMLQMSGRELADRLVAQRPDLRVLYISGYTSDSIQRHGVLEAGVFFLEKPFTPDALLHKMRQVFAAPRAGSTKAHPD